MRRADAVIPVRMQRVAIVAPRHALRPTLVRVADEGCVEIDRPDDVFQSAGGAAERLRRLGTRPAAAVLSATAPDLDALERRARADLLAGEAQLEERLAGAVRRGALVALAGWCPAARFEAVARRLASVGGALVPLPAPRGVDPPTLLPAGGAVNRSFAPLVRTYGTVAYADIDPTWAAGAVYVVMFGVMFGDAGHGLLLLVAALLLRQGRPRPSAGLRRLWPCVAFAGVTSTLTGLAYGEFFGPTGVLPVLWLNPLDQPVRLMVAAVLLGVLLLVLAFAAGTVNRWREGGPAYAVFASSGVAGAAVFAGAITAGAGLYLHRVPLAVGGAATVVLGLVTAGSGFLAAGAGGAGGALQAGVQLFDVLVRLGSNVVSFTRLAAFGLTHAALGYVIWRGTTALAHRGSPIALIAAVVVFTAGNVLAFALEALVAGVQALRLEFYELFSRVFETEGRAFRPWHVPTQRTEVAP